MSAAACTGGGAMASCAKAPAFSMADCSAAAAAVSIQCLRGRVRPGPCASREGQQARRGRQRRQERR